MYIRTGVKGTRISEIARGLNTGIQVAAHSIYNKAGHFDWIKNLLNDEPYADKISWNESDNAEYDVRDVIGIMEALNIFEYPNNINESSHPISAYGKWSIPLERFARDFEQHGASKKSRYYRLRKLVKDGPYLYDLIRHDFRGMRNTEGGRAGSMKIVEEASDRRGDFDFPFAQLAKSKYRLTKGAAMPILAAFRTYVYENPKTGDAEWRGGFERVKEIWKEFGPMLVGETYMLTQDGIRTPDQVGKNRKHWATLHMRLQMHLMREQLEGHGSRSQRRGAQVI